MATPPWAAALLLAGMGLLCSLHVLLGPVAQMRRVWREPRGSLCLRIRGLLDASLRISDNSHANRVRIHYYRQRRALYKAIAQVWMYLIGFNLVWATLEVLKFTVLTGNESEEWLLAYKMPSFLTELTGDRETPELPAVMYGLYHIASYSAIALLLASVAGLNFSDSVEKVRQEVFYGFVMAILCLISVFFPCSWWDNELMLVRMGFSVTHRSTGPTVFWSLIVTLCRVYKLDILRLIAPSYLRRMSWEGNCVRDPWSEGFSLIIIIGVTWLVERLAMEEASKTIEAREAATERKAMSSLPAATCDVVVHLNADRRVVGPNPKLAAMLLRPETSVDGILFETIFPDDESRTIVDQNLKQTTDVCARMFRTSLRDADGNTIQVHAYDTLVTDCDCEESHMIGLSEIIQEPAGYPSDSNDFEQGGPGVDQVQGRGQAGIQGRLQAEAALEPVGLRVDTRPMGSGRGRRRMTGTGTPPARTGTPAGAAGEGSLGSLGSIGGSSSTSTSSSFGDRPLMASGPLYPGLELTSKFGMELSIIQAVTKWNFQGHGYDCCSCHAGLQLLMDLTQRMQREACLNLTPDHSQGSQCKTCGIVRCKPSQGARCCTVCEKAVGLLKNKSKSRAGKNKSKCQL